MQSAIRGGTFTFFVVGGGGGGGVGLGNFQGLGLGFSADLGVGGATPPLLCWIFFFCKRVSDGTSSGTGCALTAMASAAGGIIRLLFKMESRHLLNLSVQNALHCISEN